MKAPITFHKSRSIMKGKISNSLKPPLTKRTSEIDYWNLNDIPGSGECLRQKKLIGYLR